MVFGLALVLALVVGVATMALAAVPGDPSKLGQANNIDALPGLTGAINNPMLGIGNNSTSASAAAVELRVDPGKVAIGGDSGTKVANLDADEADGEGADEIGVNGWKRAEAISAFDPQSPQSATARCVSGGPPFPRKGRKGRES